MKLKKYTQNFLLFWIAIMLTIIALKDTIPTAQASSNSKLFTQDVNVTNIGGWPVIDGKLKVIIVEDEEPVEKEDNKRTLKKIEE